MDKLREFIHGLTDEQLELLKNHKEWTRGDNDDERIANMSRHLFENATYKKGQALSFAKAATAKPMVYSADAVLSSLGASDALTDSLGRKRDPREVLVETYYGMEPLDYIMNKTAFEGEHGKGSWKNVQKVVENSRKDLEELKTPKKEVGTAAKVLGTIFAPRSLESWEQGRDASWKDIGLDIGENALMALPVAGWAGAGVKGARIGKAGRVLANVLANSAVPHIAEAADAIAYSPEENLDRSVYSEADAATGSATNVAAPYVLGRTLGRFGRVLGERFNGTEGLSNQTKNVLDDLVSNGQWKKPSKNAVEAVQMRDFKNEAHRAADAATDGAFSKFVSGEAPMNEIQTANAWAAYDNVLTKSQKATPGQVLEAGIIQSKADELGVSPSTLMNRPKNLVLTGEGTGASTYKEMLEGISPMKEGLSKASIFDQFKYTNPKADYALQGLESWAVNKYGSNKDANAVLSMASGLTGGRVDMKDLLESSKKKAVAEAKSEQQKRMASRVFDSLDKEDWSDEDRKYMELVKEKPGLLKGIGSEARDPKFRNWLMLRGTDILRGTDLYRPTPLVQ